MGLISEIIINSRYNSHGKSDFPYVLLNEILSIISCAPVASQLSRVSRADSPPEKRVG